MSRMRLFDIAANLSDKSFQGIYNKKSHHPEDILNVISRAKSYGVEKFLLAGGNLKESRKAFEASKLSEDCYCTVGVHPCLAEVFNI
jgi:TatD DNase family protein